MTNLSLTPRSEPQRGRGAGGRTPLPPCDSALVVSIVAPMNILIKITRSCSLFMLPANSEWDEERREREREG